MALYDNKHWILSNTRTSFMKSDETGMCDLVMVSDNIARQTSLGKYESYPGLDDDEDDDEHRHSYEYHTDWPYGRPPSNKAHLLHNKLEEVKKKTADTRHIKWVPSPVLLSEQDRAELFPKKNIEEIRESQKRNKVSLLTELLENCPLPLNPFQMYAKFDGNAQVGAATKRYGIFLTILPENDRNYPMKVVVISTAKVIELIGLICWKCSNAFPGVPLKESAYNYGLYIADDDGEVDLDFPCLDSKEVIAKFGFDFLALVERDPQQTTEEMNTVHVVEDPVNPMENALLTKKAQQQMEDEIKRMKNVVTAIEAPLFQAYSVQRLSKMRVRADVHLGISGDRMEIDPVVQHRVSSKLWGRQRIITHPMENIAACDLIENKSNNRAIFRVIYYRNQEGSEGGSFKQHEFEAESRVASEIVQKINHILEVLQSERRKEYIMQRERKAHRRKSFSLGPR